MKCWTLCALLLLTWSLQAVGNDNAGDAPSRKVMGYIERIVVLPDNIEAEARLDSGANTSSMHALDIEYLDDEERVRFVFEADGQRATLERPLVRHTRIVQHSGERDRRPVASVEFCLDGRQHEAEFTLTDRSELTYPVLLGRRFLADVALIDPAVERTLSAACPE